MKKPSSSIQGAFTSLHHVCRLGYVFAALFIMALHAGAQVVADTADVAASADTGPRIDSVLVAGRDTPTTSAGRIRECSPTTAFLLAIPIPGGGQFYLGDLTGGLEAIATDGVLIGALISGGASVAGIASFIVTAHVVEGLFAAQQCRLRKQATGRSGDREPSQHDQ